MFIMPQGIIYQIHNALLKKEKTLAIAESCTGGLLSKLLTDTPGSSKYLNLGIIAYSNAAKERILKIPHTVILKYGAVSRQVAILMAKNVKKISKVNYGIGITGIAGPSGGSKVKPIGTVYIAVSDVNKTICKKFVFRGTRSVIKTKSALRSLELLKKLL